MATSELPAHADLAAAAELERAATAGPFESAINVTPEAQMNGLETLTHDEMIDLVSTRIRKGHDRLYFVHRPPVDTDGPLVICDVGNGPTSKENARFIAAARTNEPRWREALVELGRWYVEDSLQRTDKQYERLAQVRAMLNE